MSNKPKLIRFHIKSGDAKQTFAYLKTKSK